MTFPGWFQYESYLLVIVRITALLAVAPVFGDRRIPAVIKIGVGIILGFVVISVMDFSPSAFHTLPAFALAAGREAMIGVTVGFVANLLFMGIQFSGQFVSLQMGFGAAQLFDPSTDNSVPVIGEFYYIISILLYLILGGYRFLIEALQSTFKSIPLAGFTMHNQFFAYLTRLSSDVFIIAMKIAAPIFITILLTEIALGLIARLVPQMNIFIFGFPLKILAGILMIAISMPIFGRVFETILHQSQTNIYEIIQLIKP